MTAKTKDTKTMDNRLVDISVVRGNILSKKSSFSVSEAYKATRTNLLFLKREDGCQRVAITSCYPSEGKTINCVNMGISLAQDGKRVLIIDCDMRRPYIRYLFDLQSQTGLSEHLAGIEKNPNICKTEYENLSVITAGRRPPNPTELLSSEAMKVMIDNLSEQFDYILFDTPPINLVTDAAVLNKHLDGYLMVVRAGVTQHDEVRIALSKLEQLEANVLGFILNDAFSQTGSYSKYSGYGRKNKYARYSEYK